MTRLDGDEADLVLAADGQALVDQMLPVQDHLDALDRRVDDLQRALKQVTRIFDMHTHACTHTHMHTQARTLGGRE